MWNRFECESTFSSNALPTINSPSTPVSSIRDYIMGLGPNPTHILASANRYHVATLAASGHDAHGDSLS